MRVACWIALFLAVVAAPARAVERAIVVLGAGVQSDGHPSPRLARRLELALALGRKDPSAQLVVTGGAVASPYKEGRVMARWLAQRGIANGRITVEDRSRHTGENADFTAPLLAELGVRRATVVTDRFHLARGMFHMRAALRDLGLGHVTLDGAGADDGLRGWRRVEASVREAIKIGRDAYFRYATR